MREYLPREPLLTPKGRLTGPGWSAEDIYTYNKESMRFAARRREWEYYQVSNARYVFQVFYGHGPGLGQADVTLVDFETGEEYHSGKRRLFPGDSFDLDFSGGEPHTLKYEDETLYLVLSFDGDTRRITVRSDRFDAELICPDQGDATVTAIPFARRTQFLYSYKKCLPGLRGHIHMHKLDYPLGENFLLLSSGRGILPRQGTRIWAAGGELDEGHACALSLGEVFSPADAPAENALFLDGVAHDLGRLYFKFRGEKLTHPWSIADGAGRIRLEFFPAYDYSQRTNLAAADIRRHGLYGKLYGDMELEEGDAWKIEGMHFFIEHISERW